MKDKVYEGKRRVKVDMVCPGCGNICCIDEHHSQPDGVIIVDLQWLYICDQCGTEMKRRVTKIVEQITETVIE